MPDVRYRVGELQLEPGDGIYLYTDGIVEQPDESGELYGEARMLKVLSDQSRRGKDVLDAMMEDVRRYAAERDVGGLGILIVKKTMSPVTYRRRNGKNILTIGKDYGD